MQRPHEIDRFQSYLERAEVKETESDPSLAQSLYRRSQSKFNTINTLEIDEDTATDYVENVYEACKLLIQSVMAADRYKPYNHEAIIAYVADEIGLGMVNTNTMNRYRKLRNDIAYRGEIATPEEAEDIRNFYIELKEDIAPVIEESVS